MQDFVILVFGWGICSTLHVIEHTCADYLLIVWQGIYTPPMSVMLWWDLPTFCWLDASMWSGGIDIWESMFALLWSIQVGMYHHCIYPIWMFYKWFHWHLYYEILRKINRIFESMKMMDKVCTIYDKLYYNIQHFWVHIMKRLQINFHFDHRFSVSRGRFCTLHVDGKSCLC